jgi:glycosyltransferase involved in cell wall biosynthesis
MNRPVDLDSTLLDSGPQIEVEQLNAQPSALRLAVVTETWPPEVNGVANTLHRLVQATLSRGHSIQLVRLKRPSVGSDPVVPADPAAAFHEMLLLSLPIPRYPGLRMGVPSKGALLRLWSHHRPDLVHIATEGPLGWSALRAATQLRIPVTSDFRTNFHRYSGHYGLGLFRKPIAAYLRKFHNRTLRTLVPTQQLAQELAASGFRNLAVVGRGVDTERFNPSRRSEAMRDSWGAKSGDLVVVHVGRLAAEKNLELLVRAFEALARQRPEARLVLVGDGPLRESLSQRCPQAIFAGQRKGEDLATHYASADLFLFPSLTETFGNVVTEAMASGLAVVSYDCAAAHEHIQHGISGLLAPEGQEMHFIAESVRAATDDPLRARLAQGALAKAKDLSWSVIARQFEQQLRQVMLAHQ